MEEVDHHHLVVEEDRHHQMVVIIMMTIIKLNMTMKTTMTIGTSNTMILILLLKPMHKMTQQHSPQLVEIPVVGFYWWQQLSPLLLLVLFQYRVSYWQE